MIHTFQAIHNSLYVCSGRAAPVGASDKCGTLIQRGSGPILYYTILYYTILYYTILYYTHTRLDYTILYYTILYYTIPSLSLSLYAARELCYHCRCCGTLSVYLNTRPYEERRKARKQMWQMQVPCVKNALISINDMLAGCSSWLQNDLHFYVNIFQPTSKALHR